MELDESDLGAVTVVDSPPVYDQIVDVSGDHVLRDGHD